jgi:hypothetical protein
MEKYSPNIDKNGMIILVKWKTNYLKIISTFQIDGYDSIGWSGTKVVYHEIPTPILTRYSHA